MTTQNNSITLVGNLKGGIIAIGGETTGFILENVSFEIDVSKIDNAQQLDGQQLEVTGYFEIINYVERGPVLTFRASDATLTSSNS